MLAFNNLAPPSRTREVLLTLDHLEESSFEGVDGPGLFADVFNNSQPGDKVTFFINNSVSPEEQELFNSCKSLMKKKNFEGIVSLASKLLKDHPSSMWAHFFYGVACKKIPDKEKYFVPAISAAVSINPNFLSGWQALHKHFLSQGGFFSSEAHDKMCLVVKVLLQLEPNFDDWGTIVGHIWDYVVSNDFNDNRILSLLSPYLTCSCPQRRNTAASVFINYILVKKKLLPNDFVNQMQLSFQILISQNDSEVYKLGLLYAAIRYFNRTNNIRQVCVLLHYIHVNNVMGWNLKTAKEFAYNLIYELFKALGEEALNAIVILKNACGSDVLNNSCYFLCNVVFKLTNSYRSVLENSNSKQGALQTWGRLLYLRVLLHLKMYQEAYEQILVDLNCGVDKAVKEKAYMEMLVDIFSHVMDPCLQIFALQLGYKYLKMYGNNVRVLHCLCLANISLKDVNTAREILKHLASLGALKDVIYLQALLEEDEDTRLDYLKSLEDSPDAYLLAAKIYKNMGKTKRVVKSMLEASFYYHGGITAFEWLGIYYMERDLVLKATKYFLEAFSNYLVSTVSINYIISIYSKHGDVAKTRAFFETVSSRSAISTDVACAANLKAGLNYMTKATETLDFHRAAGKFRKVAYFAFERKIIEMMADSLGYFGMYGSAADFHLMCHAEGNSLYVYPSVMYAVETKMIKGKGHRYMSICRNIATKAGSSPLALFTYGCALLDRAISSYSVKNFRHCVFLCQEAVLVLCRAISFYSNVASFWISLGSVFFTVASIHAHFGAVYVPTWLMAKTGQSHAMVLAKKHEAFILALRCFSVALKICKSEEMRKLACFHLGLTFRYAKTFYKELGDRMLWWALHYALNSCDSQNWQRHNLCGVILTGLGAYRDAMEFFKDALLIGAREDARDAEFNLGMVYLRLGEFTNAHEVFMHRRGNDPMDSLVWRSYMVLHRCLDDSATVLHYLWYLLFSIRHYPSLEEGMEYLRLINDSSSIMNLREDDLKKKCLLYAILRSPMFMKMAFVGDCEVPHTFNDVTASNYFFHGMFHAARANFSAAEENLLEFLKLVAEHGYKHQTAVKRSLSTLAMLSGDGGAQGRLTEGLPNLSSGSGRLCPRLGVLNQATPSQLPLAKLFSQSLMSELLGIPASGYSAAAPVLCEEMMEKIIRSIREAIGLDGTTKSLLKLDSIKFEDV